MPIHEAFYTDRFRAVSGFYKEGDGEHQADFVVRATSGKPGWRILDLACGYGRHAIPLARRGFRVTGYDQSADYIAQARRAAADAGVEVALEQLDMRTLAARDQFDAVLSMSTSLAFYDEATHRDLFGRIHAACKPGGVFLFDQANLFWLAETFARKGAETRTLPDGRGHHVNFHLDASRCILSRRSVLEGPDGREEAGWDIRFYLLPELRDLMAAVGFNLAAFYGDYDSSAYELDSKRLITVWRQG